MAATIKWKQNQRVSGRATIFYRQSFHMEIGRANKCYSLRVHIEINKLAKYALAVAHCILTWWQCIATAPISPSTISISCAKFVWNACETVNTPPRDIWNPCDLRNDNKHEYYVENSGILFNFIECCPIASSATTQFRFHRFFAERKKTSRTKKSKMC